MTTQPKKNGKSSSHLKYGEGQREQYGEGDHNRPEDVNEGADAAANSGWAGGDRDGQKTASTDKPPGGNPGKHKPAP